MRSPSWKRIDEDIWGTAVRGACKVTPWRLAKKLSHRKILGWGKRRGRLNLRRVCNGMATALAKLTIKFVRK